MKGSQQCLAFPGSDSQSAGCSTLTDPTQVAHEVLAPGAVLLHGFACAVVPTLLAELSQILRDAPLRHMYTPGGLRMSVAMSNCGSLGWVSDRAGYRYSDVDPQSHRPWPALPESFLQLAQSAAAQLGFAHFVPDACLINRYEPGCKLSLHQDKDERDFGAPIVSVSLGLPAVFLFGGQRRTDRPSRHDLRHGDVVVWGGPARLRYHGIATIRRADVLPHPDLAQVRINLTLRRAR